MKAMTIREVSELRLSRVFGPDLRSKGWGNTYSCAAGQIGKDCTSCGRQGIALVILDREEDDAAGRPLYTSVEHDFSVEDTYSDSGHGMTTIVESMTVLQIIRLYNAFMEAME